MHDDENRKTLTEKSFVIIPTCFIFQKDMHNVLVFIYLLQHPFWLQLVFRHFWGIICPTITDEGSVPEMPIWSILIINYD